MLNTIFSAEKSVARWLLLALILGLKISGATAAETKYVSMFVGQVRVFDLADVKRVAVGNSEVISYRALDNGQLLFIANGVGESTVEVWTAGDRRTRFIVTVFQQNLSRALSTARGFAESIPELKLRQVDGVVIFEGEIAPENRDRVTQLTAALPGSLNLTTEKEFTMKDMVLMDVRIIEVNRRAAEQLGIRWGQVAAGPAVGLYAPIATNSRFAVFSPDANDLSEDIIEAVGGAGVDTFYGYAGLSTGLASQIDLMAETGEASILASPKLVTRSGEVASFNSGGELPYQTIDELGRPVIQFRQYGISLDIEPLVDANGNIMTAIAAEVSSIDRANQAGDTPGLLTRNVSNVINVKAKETIVISGLATANASDQVIKVPLLGDIPYVGALFRSTEKIEEKTEIVMFVTPQLITADSQKNKDLLQLGREMSKPWADGKLNEALME
ncbi:pilus assembly protein CpaC [Marinobacter daqiaonensis]|uniref:Pilus assembly protein CpaC n=1 Tax=Marinobacter daqiaonensis TaxID=650891 RepID=A0A1I6I7Q9_9GAMM|nr:pilus assembly protein N-terminal domain-containing protein [Marinobacter daqiaonensis]SFR62743.1 pilus assembly protein CpaC [Marinobacter daqiaonensis]